ncbi:hypothetical protein BU17DRAFT_52402, partial [Hysterangium stoloniferum]
QMIHQIRHSSSLVATLPPDLRRHAKASYAIAIRWVFVLSACSSFLAFLIRLVVCHPSVLSYSILRSHVLNMHLWIPEKSFDDEGTPDAPPKSITSGDVERQSQQTLSDSCVVADNDDEQAAPISGKPRPSPSGWCTSRQLPTYESTEGGMNLEGEAARLSAISHDSA